MSIRVMSMVWDNFPRGGSDKLVMLAMADWCNDQGGSLHPSHAAVAKKCCMSRVQAQRIIRLLEQDGWLLVVGNQYGGAPGATKQYRMNVEKLNEKDGYQDDTGIASDTGITEDTGITQVLDGYHPGAQTGIASDTQTTIEPPINTKPAKAAGFCFKTALLEAGATADLAADWLAVRSKLKATNTKTAFSMFMREVNKSTYTINQALEVCCARSWKGFDADWVKGMKPVETATAIPIDRAAIEAKKKADMAAAREAYKRDQDAATVPVRAAS